MRAQGKVIELLPRESGQVVNDDEVDLALLLTTERQQFEQLGAVGGLRTLAFFFETLEDLEAFATAIVFARAELSSQTEILRLARVRNANVDDCSDHGPKHRPV